MLSISFKMLFGKEFISVWSNLQFETCQAHRKPITINLQTCIKKVIICLVVLDCVSAWSTLWNGSACHTVVVHLEGIIKYLGNIDIIGENLISFLLFYGIVILAKKPENLYLML